MNSLLNSMSLRATDVVLLFTLTIPIAVIFIGYMSYYFTIIDKPKRDPDHVRHGLSRFIVFSLFVILGLILFNLIIEFISAFFVKFKETYDISDTDQDNLIVKLSNTIMFNSISGYYKKLPIDILINGTLFCTAIYTGAEGLIAGLKTFNLDNNIAVELPGIKRKRLSAMFIVWCFLTIVSTIYTFILGSDIVNFYIPNLSIGTIVTLAILILAERTPAVISERKINKTDNIIQPDNIVTTKYTSPDTNMTDIEKVADKVTVEEIKKTIYNTSEDTSGGL